MAVMEFPQPEMKLCKFLFRYHKTSSYASVWPEADCVISLPLLGPAELRAQRWAACAAQ